jgi:purine-nucleoside phosphorylase
MSKLDKKTIVKAEPWKGFAKKNIVYIPFDSPSRIIQKNLRKLCLKEKDIGFGWLYLLKNCVVLYHSMGAPLAVLCLESLIASGSKKIFILGFCGSLNPSCRLMEAVSISKALSEEGTSRHYLPWKRIFHPSLKLKNAIEGTLRQSSLPYRKGTVVSTDAPYRETGSWLKEKQKRKIDLVDMETSAVFCLAEFRRIKAAGLLIVSDELWDRTWKKAFKFPELEEKIKKYFLPFISKIR